MLKLKWLFLAFCLVCEGLAIYCFRVSSRAQKVVDAVNGPPLFDAPVDFSKPFTNDFSFHHTVQPFYGTIYLKLQVDPAPTNWTSADVASERMETAQGELRVISTNSAVVDTRPLKWFYNAIPHSEPNAAPIQGFVGRLPLGDYRLIVATKEGVPDVQSTKQRLILRYDMIHEAVIARVLRRFGFVLAITAFISAAVAIWSHRNSRSARKVQDVANHVS
jgi:hypothetical protein